MGWFRRKEHDEEQLSAYLDGELDARQTASVERHLATCDSCTALLEEMRGMRSMLAAMPAVEPRRSFTLGAEHADVRRPTSDTPFRRTLALAPAVAFALFVGLLFVDVADFSSESTDGGIDEVAVRTTSEGAAESNGEAGGTAAEAPAAPAQSDDGAGQAGSADAPTDSGADPAEGQPGTTRAQPGAATGGSGPEVEAFSDGEAADADSAEGAEEAGEPVMAPPASDDDGISTLLVLQILAGTAFLASGFYVFVLPRLSRGGS